MSKRTLISTLIIFVFIPITILFGIYFLDDRKYYFISLIIIILSMLPFFIIFEGRKPQAREVIVIAVLTAITVSGRLAFFMIPQFKPVVALVIITGVCLGAESGFLVGAFTGFVSNFFFSQGPWAPWQMFSFGIIGFIAGILFSKGFINKSRKSLCIYGGIATLLIYGGIMNPASVIMFTSKISLESVVASYISGLGFDIIHSISTVFFLYFISQPMIEKIDRVKIKYGILSYKTIL